MAPHLVVKRGHNGRYRFVLIGEGERIRGEVLVDVTEMNRDALRMLALARIARLAEALIAGVTRDPDAARHAGAVPSTDIDVSD